MPGSRRPSRASSVASTDTNTTASQTNSAALQGASLAFGRARPSAPRTTSSYYPNVADHGALAAASSAGSGGGGGSGGDAGIRRSTSSRILPLSRSPLQMPGSSMGSGVGPGPMKEHTSLNIHNMPTLAVPQRPVQSTSPSQQAAVLAAARHPPPAATSEQTSRGRARAVTNTRPPVAPKPRRLSEHFTKTATHGSDKPTDTTSIPPTTSLVDLFEQRAKEAEIGGNRPEPIIVKPSNTLALKSPKPVRSGITSMFQLELGNNKDAHPIAIPSNDGNKTRDEPAKYDGHSSSDDSFASASEDLNQRSPPGSPPVAIPPRSAKTASPSPGQALKEQNEAKRRPAVSPSPMRQLASKPIPIKAPQRPTSAQSDSLSVASSQSLRTIPAQFNRAYPRRMTPLTTGDDLANALVASSLASSRMSSPTRLEPPTVPSRKKKSHHYGLSFSRTPSPAKGGMLHTLRKAESESSDSEDSLHPYSKHKKKRLVRKHPNKHHEGDRKRWRDAVTARERKRYEGVWAANKGIHYSFTYEEQEFFKKAPKHQRTLDTKAAVNDQVSNIVARDIWNRSRLPETVLEMVWDLVDNDSVGRLHKEEFVVGMWLIDQRLKGRKLPVKVSETVWASVRSIQGIKIKK